MTDRHIFRRYDSEMHHLHALVVEMGDLALSQLRAATDTMTRRDTERAAVVVQNDKKINDLDVQADDEIVRIIALRQPMARDLREIIALSKIVAELERAGDEARKIAGLTIRFYAAGESKSGATGAGEPPPAAVLADITDLAAHVGGMLEAVMRAFDDLNLDQATAVLGQGMELDTRLHKILRRLSAVVAKDPAHSRHFVDLVLGIRALERFGGHAKNIAGHLVFITHGIDVRHEGVETILRQVKGKK